MGRTGKVRLTCPHPPQQLFRSQPNSLSKDGEEGKPPDWTGEEAWVPEQSGGDIPRIARTPGPAQGQSSFGRPTRHKLIGRPNE